MPEKIAGGSEAEACREEQGASPALELACRFRGERPHEVVVFAVPSGAPRHSKVHVADAVPSAHADVVPVGIRLHRVTYKGRGGHAPTASNAELVVVADPQFEAYSCLMHHTVSVSYTHLTLPTK